MSNKEMLKALDEIADLECNAKRCPDCERYTLKSDLTEWGNCPKCLDYALRLQQSDEQVFERMRG